MENTHTTTTTTTATLVNAEVTLDSFLTEAQYDSFTDSLFFQHLSKGSSVNVNGNPMPWAVWNLIVLKGQIRMYVNCGMKPNRHWKITDVKNYFGYKQKDNKKFLLFVDFLASTLLNTTKNK